MLTASRARSVRARLLDAKSVAEVHLTYNERDLDVMSCARLGYQSSSIPSRVTALEQ